MRSLGSLENDPSIAGFVNICPYEAFLTRHDFSYTPRFCLSEFFVPRSSRIIFYIVLFFIAPRETTRLSGRRGNIPEKRDVELRFAI